MNIFIISLILNLLLLHFAKPGTSIPDFELQILEQKHYDDLSSASAVGIYRDSIYIAGDDIPWVYRLDSKLNISIRQKITGNDSLVNGRTPSAIKADYECMEIFNRNGITYMLVLSSGSGKVTRDTAVLITLTGKHSVLKKNIRPLYKAIKSTAGFDKNEEINIEGLAVMDGKTWLFHRGNISGNIIVELNTGELIRYLESNDNVSPQFTVYHFNLPEENGIPAGFSGACALPRRNALLFTASMEDTRSVTADGKITGSFIGIIPVSGLSEGKYTVKPLHKEGKSLTVKLEGIAIESYQNNNYVLIAVSDNDNGSSDIFRIGLNFLN